MKYTYIDKSDPTVSVWTSGISDSSITLNVDASDTGSGVSTYTYYLNGTYKTSTTVSHYTYSPLSDSTSYNLSVTVTDGAGNSTSKSISKSTDSRCSYLWCETNDELHIYRCDYFYCWSETY